MYSYILIGVGKVWDWDGLDSEFLSNGNSNGGNAAGGELMEDGGVGGSNQTYHEIYFSSNSFLLLLHSYF